MKTPGSQSLNLSELLTPSSIQLQLGGRDRDSVLTELVELVPELRGQPEAKLKLYRALLDREQLHSTGIGDGVALPHARNALVGLVNEPSVVFGRSSEGLDYGAIDGVPTQMFFLLVAPTVTQHLAMLARISRLLRDPHLRRELLAAHRAEDVIRAFHKAEEQFRLA